MILALCAGRTAPAELRARLAYDELRQRSVLEAERPGVGELALLCTCHRTEAYFTSAGDESEAVHGVAAILPGLLPTDQHDLEVLTGTDAIEHLFRVASGLDSLVVGEPQVLGQVRRAYALARDTGSTGPALANIFGRAIRLGRRVRSETALGRVGLSIGSIATAHLNERLGGVGGRAGTIVGSGEAAADAATILWKQGARLSIVSRSGSSATRQSGPAIARLRERAQAVVADEVSRALSGLDLSDQAKARIEYRMNALGMRVANKLLHGPTMTLREADDATRGAIMRIFGLD